MIKSLVTMVSEAVALAIVMSPFVIGLAVYGALKGWN